MSKMSDTVEFRQWKENATRDDWHTRFVGSDIRQLIGEVERLERDLDHQRDLTEAYQRMIRNK